MLEWKSVTFGQKNTRDDYGMWLEEWEVGTPEPQLSLLQIAGRDDPLDMSEAISGRVTYGTRTLTFYLGVVGELADRKVNVTKFVNDTHGKRLPIRCSWLDGYFSGRIVVSEIAEEEPVHSRLKVECVCNPYRYQNEPTTITVQVSGATTVTIENQSMATTPTIVTDSAMDITFRQTTWTVEAGTHYLPIVFEQGESELTFDGSGTATITYQQGEL